MSDMAVGAFHGRNPVAWRGLSTGAVFAPFIGHLSLDKWLLSADRHEKARPLAYVLGPPRRRASHGAALI
jgi:hypothetical protein